MWPKVGKRFSCTLYVNPWSAWCPCVGMIVQLLTLLGPTSSTDELVSEWGLDSGELVSTAGSSSGSSGDTRKWRSLRKHHLKKGIQPKSTARHRQHGWIIYNFEHLCKSWIASGLNFKSSGSKLKVAKKGSCITFKFLALWSCRVINTPFSHGFKVLKGWWAGEPRSAVSATAVSAFACSLH